MDEGTAEGEIVGSGVCDADGGLGVNVETGDFDGEQAVIPLIMIKSNEIRLIA